MITKTARRTCLAAGAVLIGAVTGAAAPAFAEDAQAAQAAPADQPAGGAATPVAGPQQSPPAPAQAPGAPEAAPAAAPPAAPSPADTGGIDLFSRNTIHALVDIRLAVSNGRTSFVNGGFGKIRYQGTSNGGYRADGGFYEADLIWQPRFGNELSANISGTWQRDKGNGPDLMEAFLNYLPTWTAGPVRLSGRVGLMWPEISLEHSTGGAWSTVNTITPSAINSWVGEEVKVIGAEVTARASLGDHDFSATGGVFGGNDTSGTLLSFRGWALQDIKATATGYFPLPPRSSFLTLAQANQTQNTVEIDHRPGFYARADWHPPAPVGVALFYYDNEGDPQAVHQRPPVGLAHAVLEPGYQRRRSAGNQDPGPGHDRLNDHGLPREWAGVGPYRLPVGLHPGGARLRQVRPDRRIESFQTREHGSEMLADNSEDGWAWTLAARVPINTYFTGFAEALNVQSRRGTRVDLGGLPSSFESQFVFQLAVRAKL